MFAVVSAMNTIYTIVMRYAFNWRLSIGTGILLEYSDSIVIDDSLLLVTSNNVIAQQTGVGTNSNNVNSGTSGILKFHSHTQGSYVLEKTCPTVEPASMDSDFETKRISFNWFGQWLFNKWKPRSIEECTLPLPKNACMEFGYVEAWNCTKPTEVDVEECTLVQNLNEEESAPVVVNLQPVVNGTGI